MTSWFRSWHGAPTDNKWLVIAAKAKVKPGIVSAVAWALFDHASQAEDRGNVKEFDTETYAVFSGFGENEVQAVIAAMCAKGVIDEDGRLSAWDKRQPKREDDSAERVREWRKRKAVTSEDVTQCNAEKRTATHANDTDTEQNREDTEERGTPPDGNTPENPPEPLPDNPPPAAPAVSFSQANGDGYFGMPVPRNGEKMQIDAAIRDAAKHGVDMDTFIAMCNALIDGVGWRAVVDTGRDRKGQFAREDTLTLITMGMARDAVQVTALVDAFKVARPKSKPSSGAIVEYASQLKQEGKTPVTVAPAVVSIAKPEVKPCLI